ncbi:MAG: hypothetical protein ACK54P_01940, partial [Bacteroidota bacterium]
PKQAFLTKKSIVFNLFRRGVNVPMRASTRFFTSLIISRSHLSQAIFTRYPLVAIRRKSG